MDDGDVHLLPLVANCHPSVPIFGDVLEAMYMVMRRMVLQVLSIHGQQSIAWPLAVVVVEVCLLQEEQMISFGPYQS